jgi:hypothetical protein
VTNVLDEFKKRLEQEYSDTNNGFICGLIILIYHVRKQRKQTDVYIEVLTMKLIAVTVLKQIAIWCGKYIVIYCEEIDICGREKIYIPLVAVYCNVQRSVD